MLRTVGATQRHPSSGRRVHVDRGSTTSRRCRPHAPWQGCDTPRGTSPAARGVSAPALAPPLGPQEREPPQGPGTVAVRVVARPSLAPRRAAGQRQRSEGSPLVSGGAPGGGEGCSGCSPLARGGREVGTAHPPPRTTNGFCHSTVLRGPARGCRRGTRRGTRPMVSWPVVGVAHTGSPPPLIGRTCSQPCTVFSFYGPRSAGALTAIAETRLTA